MTENKNTLTYYWLVSDKGQYYRIGIMPTEDTEDNRLAQEQVLLKYYDTVLFIRDFPMPIGTDIDPYIGLGSRKMTYDDEIIGTYVTCKSLFMLMTKHNTKQNQWEFLESYHKGLFEAVKDAYERKMLKLKSK